MSDNQDEREKMMAAVEARVKAEEEQYGKPLTPPKKTPTFPFEVMSGAAGNFASIYDEIIEVPPSFSFMGYLTCLGSLVAQRVTLKSELRTQPRLFTSIVGESGSDRKSTAISNVVRFFRSAVEGGFPVTWGIGSAEGLQQSFKEKCENGSGLLLALDELKALVSKCRIDGSVLLPCINTLFEMNEYHNATKSKSIAIEDAYLSILSASTVETYERLYDRSFMDIGFPNRVFLVIGTAARKYAVPKQIDPKDKRDLVGELGGVLSNIGNSLEIAFTGDAFEYYEKWYLALERSIHSRRLDTYAIRLAMLLALNKCSRDIDLEAAQHATMLCDWQLAIRKIYDPIDADNKMAELEQRIVKKLREAGQMRQTELKRSLNYQRFGVKMWKNAIDNLMAAGEIYRDDVTKRWGVPL